MIEEIRNRLSAWCRGVPSGNPLPKGVLYVQLDADQQYAFTMIDGRERQVPTYRTIIARVRGTPRYIYENYPPAQAKQEFCLERFNLPGVWMLVDSAAVEATFWKVSP